MRLRVVGKRKEGEFTPPDVEIGFEDGQLIVECDDNRIVDEVVDTLKTNCFVEGRGFPIYERDPATGRFRRDESFGGLVIAEYVDLAGEEARLLAAIRDGLELTERYDVTEIAIE
jgi:hypothetical protein